MIDSFEVLKSSGLNFIGNAEVRDVPDGVCDVIVCDGFTGNVILKVSEGVAKSFSAMLKEEIMKGSLMKMAALLIKPAFGALKKKMDYAEYGGAPLLGVDGLLIKAHGSSHAKAFMNAIKYAQKCLDADVVGLIREELASRPVLVEEAEADTQSES